MNKIVKKYCRAVKSALPCSRELKKKIAEQIGENIEAFLEANPNATCAELEATFGTPLQIASAHVEEMDTAALLKDLQIKRKIATAIICSCLLLIAIWGIAVTIALIDIMISTHGYGIYS